MQKIRLFQKVTGTLSALIVFLLPTSPLALTLNEDQEQELIQTLNSPEVSEIRRYLNACLSGHLDNSEDAYPCHMPDGEKGLTIKEHPQSDVSGPFAVIWVQPFDYGGQVFTVLFANPPHLAVDVWVYLEGEINPDVRSFFVRKWSQEERLYLVNDLGAYLTDTRFTR